MRALVKHAWPLWVASPTPLTPNAASLGEGGTELSPQGLYIPLSFCQFEVCSHILCQEELGAGPEGYREVLERKGPSAWENTHPHARTCFRLEKYALDLWENKFPGNTGMHGSPLSPWAGILCLSSMEGKAYPGDHASPDLCHGGKTCFSRGRGVWRREGGCDFLTTSQEPPCVILWPRVTIHEHTTSRVSMGWGGERRWEKA